ncbi:Ricin B lectin [Actinobacteria bacterium OK074]|nr:Ricin B lectin [Actinobacteria bacterium OK074]
MPITTKTITRLSMAAALAASVLVLSTPANADTTIYNNLENSWSEKCLAIPNSSTASGEGAIQWTCETTNYDQLWGFYKVAGGDNNRYEIKNLNSGMCLAMPNASTANGTQAVQWPCSGDSEQIWIQDSSYRLRNLHSDKCLAIPNSSTANGTEAIQWTCENVYDQLWPPYEV